MLNQLPQPVTISDEVQGSPFSVGTTSPVLLKSETLTQLYILGISFLVQIEARVWNIERIVVTQARKLKAGL